MVRVCSDGHATTADLQVPSVASKWSGQGLLVFESIGPINMAMISITPWHNQDELIEVRGWLYAEGEYETRRKACSQVSPTKKSLR